MNDIIISLGGRAPPSQSMPTPCEGSRWLPGSRKIDNLDDNIAAVGIMLTPEDRTRIANAMTGVQGALRRACDGDVALRQS